MNISKKVILLFSILFSWVNISNCSPGYDIYVQNITGDVYTIAVEPTDTVADLKLKIQKASPSNISPDRQKLLFGNILLNDDNRTLQDYNVNEKSNITLILRLG